MALESKCTRESGNQPVVRRPSQSERLTHTTASAILPVIALALIGVGGWWDRAAAQTVPRADTTELRSVRDFGAIGDGVADDTAAIQQAVDSGLGDVRFSRGTYRISKSITVNLDASGPTAFVATGTASIVMAGPGPAIRFVGTHGGSAAPKTVKDNVWKNQRSPMVDALEIVGEHPDACGIQAEGTMQLTITGVVIRKALHGIHLVKRNRNVIISDCHIYENRGVGVFYDDVNLHQSNIIGSHISYNGGGGIVIQSGEVRNVHIGTCDIEANMGGDGSQPTANVLLDAAGGSIGEVAIVGCTIQHTHHAPNSANIRIDCESNAVSFTEETRHGHVTIADNILSDVQVNIDIANTRGVAITGNTIWKGYESNLRVTHCESVVMSGNVFDQNPRYGAGDEASAKLGILFDRCVGCTITGNHIAGTGEAQAAMVVRNCSQFNITGCTILDCSPCGLLLENVTHSRISDCLIDQRGTAGTPTLSLRATGGWSNMLVDNMLGCGQDISEGFTTPPED